MSLGPVWFCRSLYRAHNATTRKNPSGSPSPHPSPAMSLEVYILVAFVAGVGVNPTCEDTLLVEASDVVVVVDDDVLELDSSTSSATCEGLNTTETLPCSVHVLSSDSQPFVLRPQVNLLSSPSSLQAVIAIPAPGLSVYQHQSAPNAHKPRSLSEALFTYLFCKIRRTHRCPNFYPYSSLCSKFLGGNIVHRPCIERRIRNMMCVHCL